ncbi:hypothetical protein Tco_1264461 [Tanacetum coccineum]
MFMMLVDWLVLATDIAQMMKLQRLDLWGRNTYKCSLDQLAANDSLLHILTCYNHDVRSMNMIQWYASDKVFSARSLMYRSSSGLNADAITMICAWRLWIASKLGRTSSFLQQK